MKNLSFLIFSIMLPLMSLSQDIFDGTLTQSTPYRIWHCTNYRNIRMSLEDVRIAAAKRGCVTFNESVKTVREYGSAGIIINSFDYFVFEERIYVSDDINYINQLYEAFQKYSLKAGIDYYHWIHKKEDAIACANKRMLERATDFYSIKSKFENYRSYLHGIPTSVSSNHNPYKILEGRIAYLINSTNNLNSQFEYFDYFYSVWNKYCSIAALNYGITKPICNNIVNSINSTRSFSIINQYETKCKNWANYNRDIYTPTEEVQLYKKIVEYSEGSHLSDNDFFNSCQTYIDKYSNSGYNIEEYIYNGLLKMSSYYQTKYAIDFLELTSYLADKPALEEKIKNMMISSLKQNSDEQRLRLSLYALQSNISDKNKNLLKTQLKIMEAGYTTIKTKSSADRYWVSIIDQYLTCFPTSTHKTELNTLKSKYVAECNRREAEERRQREEAERNRAALKESEIASKFPVGSKVYAFGKIPEGGSFGLFGFGVFWYAKFSGVVAGYEKDVDGDTWVFVDIYDYTLTSDKNTTRIQDSFNKMEKRMKFLPFELEKP